MFLDDLAADVVLDGLRNCFLVALEAAGHIVDRIRDPGFHDQLQQRHVVEWRNLPWLVGFDVGVNEVTHVGFVGFEVQALTTGLPDDLAQFQVTINLLLDAADILLAVAGALQFVGDIGEGAHQRNSRLVESGPLRLVCLSSEDCKR